MSCEVLSGGDDDQGKRHIRLGVGQLIVFSTPPALFDSISFQGFQYLQTDLLVLSSSLCHKAPIHVVIRL